MDLQTLIQYQLSEGLTEHELATDIGVPTFTIHRILKGRKPQNPGIWKKFARYFRIDVTLARSRNFPGAGSLGKEEGPGGHSSRQSYRKVPLLSWTQIPEVLEGGNAVSWSAPHQSMVETELSGSRVFALHVPDDSMEPLFHRGEVFFVNPELEPRIGEYVVALDQTGKAGSGFLRQLQQIRTRHVLHPLNSTYQDSPLTIQQEIIGRVVRLRKDV